MTVETAVAFPALVLLLAVAMWGVSAAAAQVACVDAARAGARAAARGEPLPEVRAAARRAAPAGAHVSIDRDRRFTRVLVTARRFKERGAIAGEEIEILEPVDKAARPLTLDEGGLFPDSPATLPDDDFPLLKANSAGAER